MIDFLNRLFGKPSSSATAKERLRLVLLSDHISLAPDLVENLKRDLVDVISRYVEVDRDKIEVNFEQQERAVAMLANIPIVSVRPPAPKAPDAVPLAAAAPVSVTSASAADEPQPAAPKRSRRRRRRTPTTSNPAPAT